MKDVRQDIPGRQSMADRFLNVCHAIVTSITRYLAILTLGFARAYTIPRVITVKRVNRVIMGTHVVELHVSCRLNIYTFLM